ncbi:MAG: LamG domain-containing protein, partial [Lentisphaerae bacterium]
MLAGIGAGEERARVIARYRFDEPLKGGLIPDCGGLKYHAQAAGVQMVPGRYGKALRFPSASARLRIDGKLVQKLGKFFTIAFWVRIDAYPRQDSVYLIRKGSNKGFQLGLTRDGRLWFHGSWGGGWYHGPWTRHPLPRGSWCHIAYTMKTGEKMRIYLNGQEVLQRDAPFAFYPVADPLLVGGVDWRGVIDELCIFANPLTPVQVQQLMANRLAMRPATEADCPAIGYPVKLYLADVRYPIGDNLGNARQFRTVAAAHSGEKILWPQLQLCPDGSTGETLPIFRETPEALVEVPLRDGPRSMPWRRQPYDSSIQPCGLWFRALEWRWGRQLIYSTERSLRTDEFRVEIWTFPLKVRGETIRSLKLSLGGVLLCERTPGVDALTLMLPENRHGSPYRLTVNGHEVEFNIRLAPVRQGDPRDSLMPVDLRIPGTSLRVFTDLTPVHFPWNKRYLSDVQQQKSFSMKARPQPVRPGGLLQRYLGIEVPRSPVTVFTATMRHGMSCGHNFGATGHIGSFQGTQEEYAAHLAALGFDATFQGGSRKEKTAMYDAWAAALLKHGIRFGFHPTGVGEYAPGPQSSNLAFYSALIPEFHRPVYRDMQILLQRMRMYPNLAGMIHGGDNAGYVPFWDWAPPHYNRPWIRAYDAWANRVALPARKNWPWPRDFANYRAFLEYIHAYNRTFGQLAYFARAVHALGPALVHTTGQFGSSPGVGGGGGYPWASIPARPMHERLKLMLAYDWNELSSSKPFHNVALIDRLRSEFPEKPVWSVVDDFALFFGDFPRQQAWAMALSRGLQGIGTNTLAHTTSKKLRPFSADPQEAVRSYRACSDWAHRYG